MPRRAILVLGMHRSGTSAMAGLLTRLGARAPATLMPANEHNPLGHWESRPFSEFHDRLLQAANTDWDAWTRVDIGVSAADRVSGEFRTLLEQEFGSAPLFVVKDPRICRFVPFWLRHLASNDVDASPVITVRSPLEVAASLAARDGLGVEHSLVLWLRHMLEAEYETRTLRRSIVGYERLLRDWKAVTQTIGADLDVQWPAASPRADAVAAGFLIADLRHHVSGIDALDVAEPLSSWLRHSYDALQTLIDHDGPRTSQALQTLDAVRQAFDAASGVFGPSFSEERHARRRQVCALETERDQLRRRAEEIDHLRRHASRVERERDGLQSAIVRRDADITELRARASTMRDEREQLAQQRDTLAVDLAQTTEHAQRLDSELESLSRGLAASTNRIHALEQSKSWRWAAPLRGILDVWLRVTARRPR